jgi:hypothetical protein
MKWQSNKINRFKVLCLPNLSKLNQSQDLMSNLIKKQKLNLKDHIKVIP